jgi:hypothetical protein
VSPWRQQATVETVGTSCASLSWAVGRGQSGPAPLLSFAPAAAPARWPCSLALLPLVEMGGVKYERSVVYEVHVKNRVFSAASRRRLRPAPERLEWSELPAKQAAAGGSTGDGTSGTCRSWRKIRPVKAFSLPETRHKFSALHGFGLGEYMQHQLFLKRAVSGPALVDFSCGAPCLPLQGNAACELRSHFGE